MKVAIMVVDKPIIAITVNDQRKPASSAIKPIKGGPIKNPRNPIVDTAANATPGDIVFDFPVALYTKGTTEETPNPTKKNPIVAGISVGNITATESPEQITTPLICNMRCIPKRVTNRSPTNLPVAIVPMNTE